MKKLSLIAALLLGATPVAAQSVQQPLGTSGEINNSTLTNTGVICIEENGCDVLQCTYRPEP
jgi:hypothetical protein